MISKLKTIFTGRDHTCLAAILFLGVITILFTFPVLEGDFFWHVKTGQWIWEHKSLPAIDPFSHINRFVIPTEHVVERTRFILRQYWLAQLALFGIWKTAGEAGMVVLRAVIYTGILAFIYWWLRRDKGGITPLATIFVVGNVLVTYSNERPQIFAYLFMVFMLYLLERLIKGERTSRTAHAALLLLVMLTWSNSHGSFILGVIVIALYGAGHLLTGLLRDGAISRPLLAILAGAMTITVINPNGFAAFQQMIDVDKAYLSSVAEYASPLRLALDHHVFYYGFWLLLAAAVAALALNFRSMAFHHLAVIASLALLSLTAIRYVPFFVLAAPLIAVYLPDGKLTGKYRVLPFLVLALWIGVMDFHNTLKFRAARFFPKRAVEFINTARPPGNILNYILWGGYLICYTDYPVFVDGRSLAVKFTELHNQFLAGTNWKSLISIFQINTIFIPGMDEINTQPYPILLQLLRDNDWALVYQDDEALIFMRNIPQNRDFLERHAINKDRIETHITTRLDWQLKNEM